jgi:hypothetical protein
MLTDRALVETVSLCSDRARNGWKMDTIGFEMNQKTQACSFIPKFHLMPVTDLVMRSFPYFPVS